MEDSVLIYFRDEDGDHLLELDRAYETLVDSPDRSIDLLTAATQEVDLGLSLVVTAQERARAA
jgi:hypothetical protein